MKNIKEIKKELEITDVDISNIFGYKTLASYTNSSAKPRIEKGIELIYNKIKNNKEMKKHTAELLIEKKNEFQTRVYSQKKMDNPNYTYGGQDDNGNYVYLCTSPISRISEQPLSVFGLWNDGNNIDQIGSFLNISTKTTYNYINKLVSVFCNKQAVTTNNENADKYLKEVRAEIIHLGLLDE